MFDIIRSREVWEVAGRCRREDELLARVMAAAGPMSITGLRIQGLEQDSEEDQ